MNNFQIELNFTTQMIFKAFPAHKIWRLRHLIIAAPNRKLLHNTHIKHFV